MSYDPTKPANNSPVVSAELRNQFAGLKQLLDALPDTNYVDDHITQRAAGNCDALSFTIPTISDPPTQSEVQYLADTLDNLIALLKQH